VNNSTAQNLIERLDDILDHERAALLKGDLDTIMRLAPAKEALIDALNGTADAEEADLEGLQGKVTRNQVLLSGTLQGIRKVATRIAALRRIRKSLETYDASGRKQTIEGEIDHQVEKRA
jgi:hypothetical protein